MMGGSLLYRNGCAWKLFALVAMASFTATAGGNAQQSDRLKLWGFVHDQCVPGQLTKNPAPCVEVDVADGVDKG
jgi:CDP-diacylglycerol pyrophosphatase